MLNIEAGEWILFALGWLLPTPIRIYYMFTSPARRMQNLVVRVGRLEAVVLEKQTGDHTPLKFKPEERYE